MPTLVLLAICQALTETGNIVIGVTSALTGYLLVEDKALATLPIAMLFLFMMIGTVPASYFMQWAGRRIGFTVGQLIGATAAALSVIAIFQESFWLFVVGGAIFGIHGSFYQYYRFAAADSVDNELKSRAIGLILGGGVVGAIVGPELSKFSRNLFQPVTFAGSFAIIFTLCLITVAVLQFIKIPALSLAQRQDTGRSLINIARQPVFVVAVLSSMLGFVSMTLIMTSTPLAITAHNHSFSDVAFVIQWHVLGMFAPSFITGHLIHRFGTLNIIIIGSLLIMTCIITNVSGVELKNFWIALVALGIGWNFMFIGGTTLLTQCYQPEERAKVQGINDLCVFGAVALAAFSSGILHDVFGWKAVNLGVVLPIAIALSAAIWLRVRDYLNPLEEV